MDTCLTTVLVRLRASGFASTRVRLIYKPMVNPKKKSSAADVARAIKKLADKKQAAILQRFFKTGPGQYGEGDRFLGIKVPVQRQVAKQFFSLPLPEIKKLITSKYHEQRLTGLLILVDQFSKADRTRQKKIFDFYFKNISGINNWDLVDLTAPNIVGTYLLNRPRTVLYRFARSKNLWERRIAIIATFAFIRHNQFADTIKISKILLTDRHDLIHKAVGWMLREVGKRNQQMLKRFLNQNVPKMPRTTLRYAIEKFPQNKRKRYLI